MTDIHAALGLSTPPIRLLHPPVPRPSRTWRNFAFASVAIMLVLAVATAGYFATRSSTTPPHEDVPQVVLGLASQESEPSPVAASSCDMSGDIPLLVGVDESPLDRTSVIVTLDQELKVVCALEETVLATNVQVATPTQTPYVLMLLTQTGHMLLNVETGESLHVQQPPMGPEQSIGMQIWEGWALLPSTDNPDSISLYLLESFTEIPIVLGNEPIGVESVDGMAIGAIDDVFALVTTEETGEETKTLSGLFIANLDGTSHDVETPAIVNPMQIAISPDGETVAIVSYEGERVNGIKTLSLLDTANGSLINEIEIGTDSRFIDINWLNDGPALLYSNDTALYMLTAPDGEPTTILEGDNVQGLALTRNDNVVAIGHRKALDSGGFQPVTTIIDLETGEQVELDGRDLWSGSSMSTRRSTLLLTVQSTLPTSEPTIYTAVDAVTGENLGEIERDNGVQQGFQHASWGYDRNINIVGFGPDSIWKFTDEQGEPSLIAVPAPPIETDITDAAMQMTLSPHGMVTLRMYAPNSAWILLPGEETWVEVELPDPTESQGVNPNIGIIPGTD